MYRPQTKPQGKAFSRGQGDAWSPYHSHVPPEPTDDDRKLDRAYREGFHQAAGIRDRLVEGAMRFGIAQDRDSGRGYTTKVRISGELVDSRVVNYLNSGPEPSRLVVVATENGYVKRYEVVTAESAKKRHEEATEKAEAESQKSKVDGP